MRHTNYGIGLLACLLFTSCDVDSSTIQSNWGEFQNPSHLYALRAINNYLFLLKNSGTVEDDMYILETEQTSDFMSYLEVRSLVETTDGLEVNLLNGSILKLSVNWNNPADYHGFSLSKVKGPYHYSLFYDQNGYFNEPDVADIKCKCKPNTSNESCDAGGKGSPDCSISGSATGGGTGILEKCSVKCSRGYYACCKSV